MHVSGHAKECHDMDELKHPDANRVLASADNIVRTIMRFFFGIQCTIERKAF